MATVLRVPKLAVSMQHGTLQKWLAASGSHVREGQPLYSIEAEKAVMDIDSPASGILRAVAVEGATYEVGAVLGEIVDS